MTDQESMPFDPANPLLSSVESRLDTGILGFPGGVKGAVLTVRTASMTATVMLTPEDLATWISSLQDLLIKLLSDGPVLPPDVTVIPENGSRPRSAGVSE